MSHDGPRKRLTKKGVGIEKNISTRRRLAISAGIVFLIGIAIIFARIYLQQNLQRPGAVAGDERPTFKQPGTLKELLALSPTELERCDIARMNLLCAEDLTGAENLNADEILATLDQWAEHIQVETDRNFHRFKENPAYYYDSEAFYKMLMMAVVLYEDYGIRYNPRWISAPSETQTGDHFFADSSDILIHGLIGGRHLGTCSSMPVLYIALARRLGYPVKLVTTKEHLFMRWDSPAEQFEMDATARGINKYNDNFYKQFPFSITEQEIKDEGYLKSLSPKEELSVFLAIRGACLMEAGRSAEAKASFSEAYRLVPEWKGNRAMMADAQPGSPSNYPPVPQQSAYVTSQPQAINIGTPDMPTDPNPLKQR